MAVRAYPRPVRSAHGEEMLSTALDVSGTSRTRFLLELVGLVRAGMRLRAVQNAQAGPLRVVADGICLSAVWLLMLLLSSELGNRLREFDPRGPWHPLSPLSLALLGAALALALIGLDRIAGVTALLFVVSLFADPSWRELTNDRRGFVVPLFCFATLALAPRRRTPAPRRLAWLGLAAALALISSISDDPTAAILVLGLLILVPPALATLPTDPRFAIACALTATTFGIDMTRDQGGPGILGILFLCAAPAILIIAATRTSRLRAQAHT